MWNLKMLHKFLQQSWQEKTIFSCTILQQFKEYCIKQSTNVTENYQVYSSFKWVRWKTLLNYFLFLNTPCYSLTFKTLRQLAWNMSSAWVIYFRMKEILDFNVPQNFQNIRTCFDKIVRKLKNHSPSTAFTVIKFTIIKIKIFSRIGKVFCIESVKFPWYFY